MNTTAGDFQKEFMLQMNKENAKRLQVIAVVLFLVAAFQAVIYSFSDNNMFTDGLIKTKWIIIVLGVFVIGALQLVKRGVKQAVDFSGSIIFISAFLMIFFSVINTFYAQGISNDISIYLLVLLAVIAANRMDFKSTLIMLAVNYFVFAVGMRFFQSDPRYLFSHRSMVP
ncbi:MAG TPA: hypothetical protein PLU43_02000 [Lachnospiraceae bacterium]|nr:hypothetical protein [Lachnospiraceae bacterium]